MKIVNINKKDDTDNTCYIFLNIFLGILVLPFVFITVNILTKGMKSGELEMMGELSGCMLAIMFILLIGMYPMFQMMQERNQEIDEINEKNKNYYEYIVEYNIFYSIVENITTEDFIKLIMQKETFDEKCGETKSVTIKVPNDNQYNDFVRHINEMERQRFLEKEKLANKIYTEETHNL